MPIFDHPILRKELLTRLRSGKTFIALALWIILNMAAMSVGWRVSNAVSGATQQRRGAWRTGRQTRSASARTSVLVRAAFHSVSITQLLLAAVLAPAFAVGAFAVERKQGTYDMLLTTPIPTFSIVVTKLASCVCVMVLLVISSLPALSMVLLFGGVTGTELMLSAGVIVIAVLFFSSIGLFWSAWCRTTARAALASYVMVGALAALTFVPGKLWRRPSRILQMPRSVFRTVPRRSWADDTAWASPFSAAVAIARSRGQKSDFVPIANGLGVQALAALLLVVLASPGARRAPEPARPRGKPLIADERTLEVRRTRFPYFLIDPLGRRPHIGNDANPMFVKELRTILFKSGSTWVRIFYVSTILHLLTMPYMLAGASTSYYHRRDPQVNVACFGCIVLLLLAPIGAAGSVSKEREGHTLDLLRTTPLTPGRVIRGKILAALMCGGPVLAGVLFSWLFSTVAGYVEWPRLLAVTLVAASTYFLAIVLSILASAATGRTGVAFPLAYGFVAIMCFSVPWRTLLGSGRYRHSVRWSAAFVLVVVVVLTYWGTLAAYRLRTRS